MPSALIALASSLSSLSTDASAWLVRTTWQAAVLIALVVLVQLTLGK